MLAAIKYRKNLMLFFTGDDVFHISGLDCCWWSLTCCGSCTGEWTRCLTMCACCPRRWRGVNLVRKSGQLMGLSTTPVEIKNIVVGDLPYRGRADFYLTVECAANPEMVTSVAEMRDPKVIHFPEVFTLRLRYNPVETPVRIVVRAIHIVGYEDIAYCHIDAMRILEWASAGSDFERSKRLELRPVKDGSGSTNPLTPPWIMLEFDQPTETRDLEHFNPNRQTIRTAVTGGTYKDMKIHDFKREYTLETPSGGPCSEIPEECLDGLERLNSIFGCVGWCFTLMVSLFVSTFLVVRSYFWTCWRQITPLTVAYLHNAPFPVNDYNLTKMSTHCEREVEGTGLHKGDTPCLPTDDEVIDFCKPAELGGHFPMTQPRPHAFEAFIKEYSDLNVRALPCHWRTCEWRPAVVEWDWVFFGVVVLGPLALCMYKWCSRRCIRGEVDRLKVYGHQQEPLHRDYYRSEKGYRYSQVARI
jgi:hypothetical protein